MQNLPSLPRICIDCQYLSVAEPNIKGTSHYCEHPMARDLVTGQSTPAYDMRYRMGACGRDGKLFNEKLLVIGGYTVLPSDDGLLASLQQRGYAPVFQEFPESQRPEQEPAVLFEDPQEKVE